MAKLKFTFQNEYYKTHRRQLRDYAFGYFDRTASLAASVAPITNTMMGIPMVKNLVARILGITAQRPFPKFKGRTGRLRLQRNVSGGKKIIFLPDPFARYIEPETEQAALEILSSCGYEVQILPVIGAGASLFSKGFIEPARRHAEKVLDALNKVDPGGTASIVGIEPPEVYFLKNEYIDLLPEKSVEIQQRLKSTWLLDEFLLRSDEFNDLRIVTLSEEKKRSGDQRKKIKFHPHCHQRAEGLSEDGRPTGTSATVELLCSCGFEVELLDTGCCGMAGTFGYDAEHYDLSMKVGELKLFPILRQLSEQNTLSTSVDQKSKIEDQESTVLSSGAACRMQIRQGSGVEAIHPVVMVAQFLKEAVHDKE